MQKETAEYQNVIWTKWCCVGGCMNNFKRKFTAVAESELKIYEQRTN